MKHVVWSLLITGCVVMIAVSQAAAQQAYPSHGQGAATQAQALTQARWS